MPTQQDWSALAVDELEALVRHHNKLYWIDDDPEISDPDYDRLIEALRDKAPHSEVLSAIGAAGIEGVEISDRAKIRHDAPMLSLAKCYDEETLRKWFGKFEGDVVVSPKVDGVAVSIKYDAEGNLLQAVTRGDGAVGEEITENALQIVDLPRSIDTGPLEVRGEAYLPLSIFNRHFKDDYANPRNLTAGALKQKFTAKTKAYQVHFFAYDLLGEPAGGLGSEWEKLDLLAEEGFSVVPSDRIPQEQLQEAYDQMLSERASLDYETDGVVYKANDLAEQGRMGMNSHHPRYAIAYKYQGESGRSVLRQVEWNVSRTGAINPVGVVDPVELSGATVTRVSLHNLAIMESLGREDQGLMLGSIVLMMRRGGVIPNLERVIEHGEDPVELPETCPACGAETYRDGDILTAAHNENCRNTKIRQLEHFTSVMDIKGFGPKMLEKLYDEGITHSPEQLFVLQKDELVDLDRVGDKLADRLLAEVESKKQPEAEKFLRALGIHELGRHVSKILVREYHSMEEIFALEADELAAIHTIGDVIAASVTQGLEQHRELIEALLEHIEPQFPDPQEVEEVSQGPLLDKKFLFTGTLESMTRKEAQSRVEALAGSCPSSVSRSLDYLVIGDEDYARYEGGWRSSKLKKVEKYIDDGLSIAIINESTFLEMIAEADGD